MWRAKSLNDCLWSLSLSESSTGHSLKLGGKSHRAVECGQHGYTSVEPGSSVQTLALSLPAYLRGLL